MEKRLDTILSLALPYRDTLTLRILRLGQTPGVLFAALELSAPRHRSLMIEDADIRGVDAEASGLFVASAAEPIRVRAGERLGRIVAPFTGQALAEPSAPVAGVAFSRRHYPLVYLGSLLARIAAITRLEAAYD